MCSGKQEGLHHKISALLEFSALDDVKGFKDAVEKEGHDVDEAGLWYGRRVGSKEVGYEERTPLMIAAMFGSKGVLCYILGTGCVDVNQACGSDRATALHCAVAGGSATSPEVIKLLLDASADISAVDANGNRSCDLIGFVSNGIFNSRKRILEALLEGKNCIDEAFLTFEEEEVGQMARQKQQYMDAPRIISKDETEKKDYLVDLSLPDIKDEIYGTDEFRMYTFKVKPCSRAYSHDWTECPFVHPGENARRRDPTKYHYSCVPCPEFRKGLCSKGDACEYAHGIFESWLHPAQYRTRLCKDETGCTRKVCFFAHKLEELRPLYATTGSAMPSPQSYPASASSLEPLTPSGASSPVVGSMWQTQSRVAVPTLDLSKSRFKNALKARDIDLDIELLELENHRLMHLLLIDESLSSPSRWKNTIPNSPTNLEDIFGSQLQSPTGIQGYSSGLATSNVIGSPSSAATLALNSRNAAFSKRSQSFIERSMASYNSELPSPATSIAVEPSILSGWGSPDGKLDWAIRGEELNKLRKSASFGFRGTGGPLTMAATATTVPPNVDEPDVSWVHSLVKDASPMESGQYSVEEPQQQPQCYLEKETHVVPAWFEQLYMEQEQMVA